MNSLTERVQQAWSILLGKQQVEQPKTQGVADASQLGSLKREWDEAFSIDSSRSERYSDFRKMDQGIIATMISDLVAICLTFDGNSSITDDVLNISNAFKIQCDGYATSGPKQVIRQVLEDTNLRQLCRFALRDCIKFGDDFWEPLSDPHGNLVRLFPHHVADMVVTRTEKGDLDTGVDSNGFPKAYQQRSDVGAVVAGWYPGDIIHIKYWANPKFGYSEYSFLDQYRSIFKRLDWLEQSCVIARVTRSFPRMAWRIDLTGKSAEEGKKIMRNFANAVSRRETPSGMQSRSPLQPDEDYYISGGYRTGPDQKLYPILNSLDLIDPKNEGLANIQDITDLRNQLFSQVPSEMVGVQQQRPQDVTDQQIAMASFIKYLQTEVLEAQFIRPVIDRALWLKGYKNAVNYRVVFPSAGTHQSWKLADANFRLGLGFRTELESKVTNRIEYLTRKYGYTEDEAEAVLTRYEEEEKRFGSMSKGDQSSLQARGNQSAGLDEPGNAIREEVCSRCPNHPS